MPLESLNVDLMPRPGLYPHHFSVRVTADELRDLHARASTAGLSLARYPVEVGLASANPPTVEEEAGDNAKLA